MVMGTYDNGGNKLFLKAICICLLKNVNESENISEKTVVLLPFLEEDRDGQMYIYVSIQ
jgi:hypothetical protein